MRTSHEPRGQVLVLVALAMTVLLGALALAVDYGLLLSSRRDTQSVADAAALAAAAQLGKTGDPAPTADQRTSAGVEALVYLNDHFGWGYDRAWANSNVASALQQTTPFVVNAAGRQFCVWIWTPTPSAAVNTTGAAACQSNPGGPLYAPANYPNGVRKTYVRVDSPRPTFFAKIFGFGDQIVAASAVAGGTRSNYAVIALKPDLRPGTSADTQLAIKIGGNSTLRIPRGDVGSNFSLEWAGGGSSVIFSAGTDQAVILQDVSRVQGNGVVQNGDSPNIQSAVDPIEDPAYGKPAACSGALTAECWAAWPPSTGGPTGKGVYPACATAADIAAHRIRCADGPTLTLWPGKYEKIEIPGDTTVTMNAPCFSGDAACISAGRAGVYYFTSNSPNSGLLLGGSTGAPVNLTACGVLLIFDPYETGGSRMRFAPSGPGNTANINANSCNMKSEPTNPTGTVPFVWYGHGATDFTNPISMWVRPNGVGYNLTSTNNGSNVIVMGAGSSINMNGVIYAPDDNTKVAGGGAGSGVGQIVSWTIEYLGNSNITESFQGPAELRTRLLQ